MTIGTWFGRDRFVKIQIGSVCSAPAVNVVTMISSNESANASRPPATSAVRIAGKRDKSERLERVGAEVHRGLLEVTSRAAQACDDVVVDHDDAEGRMADDDVRSPRPIRRRGLAEGRVEGHPGHDARAARSAG